MPTIPFFCCVCVCVCVLFFSLPYAHDDRGRNACRIQAKIQDATAGLTLSWRPSRNMFSVTRRASRYLNLFAGSILDSETTPSHAHSFMRSHLHCMVSSFSSRIVLHLTAGPDERGEKEVRQHMQGNWIEEPGECGPPNQVLTVSFTIT